MALHPGRVLGAYDAPTGEERWSFLTPSVTEYAVGDAARIALSFGTTLAIHRANDAHEIWSGQRRPGPLAKRDTEHFVAIALTDQGAQGGDELLIALDLSQDNNR